MDVSSRQTSSGRTVIMAGKKIGPMTFNQAAGLLLIAFLLFGTGIGAYISSQVNKYSAQVLPSTTTSTTGPAAGNVPGLIKFVITDPFGGGSATPTTFKVYPAAGSVIGGSTFGGTTASETITISSGAGTSALQYVPGTVLYIYELLSGSQTIYGWKVVAPGVTSAQQAYGTAAQVNLFDPKTPTFKITVTDDKGNSLTSGTTVENFTNSGHCPTNNNCLGESTITLTVTVTNTVANSGILSNFDPVNSLNQCIGLLMKENGTTTNVVGVTGFPTSGGAITVGSTRYWQGVVPDGASSTGALIQSGVFFNAAPNSCSSYSIGSGGIAQQSIAGVSVGGSWSFKMAISQGSAAHGNTLTLTPSFYQSYDPVYALSNSASGGTDAAQLASAYFHIKFGA